jgi:hypothetical protein
VDNFVGKLAKARAIFLKVQGLRLIGKSLGGLHEHKFVHDAGQFIQSQFQQLELVEKDEAVVNHAHGFVGARKSSRNKLHTRRQPDVSAAAEFIFHIAGAKNKAAVFLVKGQAEHGGNASADECGQPTAKLQGV